MSKLVTVDPEYVYVTIPAEYICVYHRILAMLADYGEDMLKDCKASCTDKNSGVIECFNMFNAAVAARKLGKDKLAETLIKYIKAKINQIYQGKDNSTSFVFPVDPNGRIKAFVSCGELPKFEINADDAELYEHEMYNGFDEHFILGPEDKPQEEHSVDHDKVETGLVISFTPSYEKLNPNEEEYTPCGELLITYNGESVDKQDCAIDYYFDNIPISYWDDIVLTIDDVGMHNFKVAVVYKDDVDIANQDLMFEIN